MNKKQGLEHWVLSQDERGIAWLGFDYKHSSVNVLSSEALMQLDDLLDEVTALSPKGVVVYSLKEQCFIMGADVKSFSQLESSKEARQLIDLGHKVCHKLEDMTMPTVALISGHCLGGGLELALCCDFLIASSDKTINLGLPEVKIGIHPGFGGTVRMVERMGAFPALKAMLSGRNISVFAAKKQLLLDEVTPAHQIKKAAVHYIFNSPDIKLSVVKAISQYMPPLFFNMASKLVERELKKRVNKVHYPAPYRLLDLWKSQSGKSREKQLTLEKESVVSLFSSHSSRNLVRVFHLRGKLNGLANDPKAYHVKTVHVIGAGVMGGDIATWCAAQGIKVTLQDSNRAALSRAKQRSWKYARRSLKKRAEIHAMMDRITIDPLGDGMKQASLVIEAIIEDANIKRSLYKDIESKVHSDTLIATNTSSIPLDILGKDLVHPQRFLGLHFFNPVTKMPLVEVIASSETSETHMSNAYRFVHDIKRLPLPVKSSVGFLVNRVLMAYLVEAVILVDEGVPPSTIDSEAMAFGMPMGPIELADKVGLDICRHVLSVFGDVMCADEATKKALYRLDGMVEKGQLGLKSGQGFYHYKKGRKIGHRGASSAPITDVRQRLFARLFNECIGCLDEKIVENVDFLDAGMIFGTGFAPFTGGPMHYLEGHANEVYANLARFSEQYGSRFTSHNGWKKILES